MSRNALEQEPQALLELLGGRERGQFCDHDVSVLIASAGLVPGGRYMWSDHARGRSLIR